MQVGKQTQLFTVYFSKWTHVLSFFIGLYTKKIELDKKCLLLRQFEDHHFNGYIQTILNQHFKYE